MIEVCGLSKRYSHFLAVDNISLDIKPGQIFGFLGANGAGKTTTIRMLVGILKPTSGEIRIGGFDMLREPLKAKQIIGYIPDRPHIYPKLTGREFLYFISELYNIKPSKNESRIDEVLSDFGLLEWQNELVENYSHGMRQRLATCAALVHNPQVLIIDEPMVGLDPHAAKLFKDQLKRYAQLGVTVFLSTHSLNVAEELCDHLAIIQRGQILARGTFAELKQNSGHSEERLESLFLKITAPNI